MYLISKTLLYTHFFVIIYTKGCKSLLLILLEASLESQNVKNLLALTNENWEYLWTLTSACGPWKIALTCIITVAPFINCEFKYNFEFYIFNFFIKFQINLNRWHFPKKTLERLIFIELPTGSLSVFDFSLQPNNNLIVIWLHLTH